MASSFSDQIRLWGEKTNQKREKVIGSVNFQLSESIVEMTPVDEGRARANWFASLNFASEKITDDVDKIGSSTLEKAKEVSEKSDGEIFYFINNLPYIRRLEFGWSEQAPSGMVRLTVRRFKRALRKALNDES